jgi:hypothetical protein
VSAKGVKEHGPGFHATLRKLPTAAAIHQWKSIRADAAVASGAGCFPG